MTPHFFRTLASLAGETSRVSGADSCRLASTGVKGTRDKSQEIFYRAHRKPRRLLRSDGPSSARDADRTNDEAKKLYQLPPRTTRAVPVGAEL